MKVALITTGVMELNGLAAGLARLFPDHEFVSVPREPAMPGRTAVPFDGFTSAVVSPTVAAEATSTVRGLVARLAGCVYPTRDACDLAVLLDDLELANYRQESVVIQAVQDAVKAHLASFSPREQSVAQQTAAALRTRASFHLALPMTESWFYGDPSAMRHSEVPVGRTPSLVAGLDPEDFEAADAAFSAETGGVCAQLLNRNVRRRENRRPPWEVATRPGMPWHRREKHPKAYLQWLCRDPAENSCTAWKESKQGAAALAALDWRAVLQNPAHYGFLRALLEDLADGLGVTALIPAGTTSAPTALRPPNARTVLRNL